MSPGNNRVGPGTVDAWIGQLGIEDLREIVRTAAEAHDDVARAVRLIVARGAGDLSQLRTEIDATLRTRRFLDYRDSNGWAAQAVPVVGEIRDAVATSPSLELVALIERAIGHLVKVIMHADDSDGAIGNLARMLLDLHAQACDAGVADPVKLSRWMIRFIFDDQDFFVADPVRYASALGEPGVASYRREVHRRRDGGDTSFAAGYAEKRLAVLDGNIDEIVRLLGGDLTSPHQFVAVAEAMAELGRGDDVIGWARRGIAETSGWQIARLYDLAAMVFAQRGASDDLLDLRSQQHRHMPSANTYALLRTQAEASGEWGAKRDAARSALAERDLGGLVDVLLADGEPDSAWAVPRNNPGWDPGQSRWMQLAEAREASHPVDALALYFTLADAELETTGKAAYVRAVRILKKAKRAAAAAGRERAMTDHLERLREEHRRRPTLMAVLDKAGLT